MYPHCCSRFTAVRPVFVGGTRRDRRYSPSRCVAPLRPPKGKIKLLVLGQGSWTRVLCAHGRLSFVLSHRDPTDGCIHSPAQRACSIPGGPEEEEVEIIGEGARTPQQPKTRFLLCFSVTPTTFLGALVFTIGFSRFGEALSKTNTPWVINAALVRRATAWKVWNNKKIEKKC